MFGDPVTNPSAKLPKGWRKCKLIDLQADVKWACVGGPFGSNLTSKDYVPKGVPVIRGTNLSGETSNLNEEGFVFVSPDKANTLRQNTAYRGDVVFTQRGTLGQVGYIPNDSLYKEYIVSQSQMKLTPNTDIVDPIWLVSYFQAPGAMRDILSRTLATGVPHINLTILKSLTINLPPLDSQKRFRVVRETIESHIGMLQDSGIEEDLFNSLVQRAFRGEL